MPEYDNNMKGTLWKNERKEAESQPDYTGSMTVNNIEYWLSAWVNIAGDMSKRAGAKYFKLSLKPKDEQPAKAATPTSAPAADPFDDDIPF